MSWKGESSEATIQNPPKTVEVNHMRMSSDIHPCSGFKKRRTCLPFLPNEIISKILLCLPVDILYNVMRCVCREWYNIIRGPKFIDTHLQESSPTGFLIQFPRLEYSTLYLEMREHGVEITDLNLCPEGMRDGKGFKRFRPPSQSLQYEERICHSRESLKFPGIILASCNGLVLVSDSKFLKCFHVANLFSRQWVCLPPLIAESTTWSNAGLGYADSCKAYKVVCPYGLDKQYHCGILTLGVDKAWRCVASSNHMSLIPREDLKSLFMSPSYSSRGYVHWVYLPRVLSLEVENESFHVSVVPNECGENLQYLATESCLAFASVWANYIFELWSLVEVETSHWKKLQKVDLAAQVPVIEQRFGLSKVYFWPFALSKNGELFIVRFSFYEPYFMICNVKSGAIDYLEDGSWNKPHPGQYCAPFVKSLVSPISEIKFM